MKYNQQGTFILFSFFVFFYACSSEEKPTGWTLTPTIEDTGKDLAVPDLSIDSDSDSDLDSGIAGDMPFPGKVCIPSDDSQAFRPGRNIEEVVGCVTASSTIDLGFYFEDIPLRWFESLREIGPGNHHLLLKVTEVPDVDSFQNLERVGGMLSIIDASQLRDISGFRKIYKIGGQLTLDYLPIRRLDGFGRLESVGGLEFDTLDELESLEGLSSLKKVKGDVSVSALKITDAQFRGFLEGLEIDGEVSFNGNVWIFDGEKWNPQSPP